MRISDWSSDVCSSDLTTGGAILYYPTAPSYELEGYAMVAYGNYDARIAEGALNLPVVDGKAALRIAGQYRSEEHTSELQSLMRISYAVFCLKKKNIKSTKQHRTDHVNNDNTQYDVNV